MLSMAYAPEEIKDASWETNGFKASISMHNFSMRIGKLLEILLQNIFWLYSKVSNLLIRKSDYYYSDPKTT